MDNFTKLWDELANQEGWQPNVNDFEKEFIKKFADRYGRAMARNFIAVGIASDTFAMRLTDEELDLIFEEWTQKS